MMYAYRFEGMGIIHTAKKYIVAELKKKMLAIRKAELGVDQLSITEEENWKKQASHDAKTINLNEVCLCFQAFVKDGLKLKPICKPVFSRTIKNMSKYYYTIQFTMVFSGRYVNFFYFLKIQKVL